MNMNTEPNTNRELTVGDLPTREFVVHTPTFAPVTVTANVHRLGEGALELLRYAGESLWTVALFAPGNWAWVEIPLLSDEELAIYTAIANEQSQLERVRQSLSLPGGNKVRG